MRAATRLKLRLVVSWVLIQLTANTSMAQTDSLFLKNDDLIVGEIKNMNKGVLVIETPYSDVDFRIAWNGIKRIISRSKYLVTTSDGTRINGTLKSLSDSILRIEIYDTKKVSNNPKKKVTLPDRQEPFFDLLKGEIVYLNSINDGFWSRLKFDIDFGFNLTRANNFRQFALNSMIGYQADRWEARMFYKDLQSFQDATTPIQRSEFGANYNYFLPKDWYLLYQLNLLSNTEQLIDLRTSNMIGLGKFLIHTNKSNLGIIAGGNLNLENFSNRESVSKSAEAFLGATYDIFDIGELDLLTSIVAFPSLTEKNRFRTDFKFDIRYKFDFNLYLKAGTTINFDNRPTDGARKTDYILLTSIGWSL